MDRIVCEGVAIGYGKRVVAQGISLELRGGTMTCLIGRNGLGKSTLLRTMAGFQPPLAGHIIIRCGDADYDLAGISKPLLSRMVAVVLTERVDIANVTVHDVVGMGRMPYTNFFGMLGKDDERVVDECMDVTGITEFAGRDISTLSDGERQKVMIARAVAQQTPVILLDEPTAFLDYGSKVDTFRLLGRLAHEMGKIVLVSTHDLGVALRHADRLITIGQGIEDVDKAALGRQIGLQAEEPVG